MYKYVERLSTTLKLGIKTWLTFNDNSLFRKCRH